MSNAIELHIDLAKLNLSIYIEHSFEKHLKSNNSALFFL